MVQKKQIKEKKKAHAHIHKLSFLHLVNVHIKYMKDNVLISELQRGWLADFVCSTQSQCSCFLLFAVITLR